MFHLPDGGVGVGGVSSYVCLREEVARRRRGDRVRAAVVERAEERRQQPNWPGIRECCSVS
jgi:hypothetical protein